MKTAALAIATVLLLAACKGQDPQAAAQAAAAQVAGLEPAGGAAFLVVGRAVRDEAFHGHADDGGSEAGGEHGHGEPAHGAAVGAEPAHGHDAGHRGQQGGEVPTAARPGEVHHRGPEELPGLRHVAQRHEPGDGLGADLGLAQLVGQRDAQEAVLHAERRDEQREDPGRDGAGWGCREAHRGWRC